MVNEWLNNKDSYLVKGESLNQIIAMLVILQERNTSVDRLSAFIEKLKGLDSYNDMLHTFALMTRAENMSIQRKSGNKKNGMALEDILRRLNMRLLRDGEDGES
jgi:hypothetical protein